LIAPGSLPYLDIRSHREKECSGVNSSLPIRFLKNTNEKACKKQVFIFLDLPGFVWVSLPLVGNLSYHDLFLFVLSRDAFSIGESNSSFKNDQHMNGQ